MEFFKKYKYIIIGAVCVAVLIFILYRMSKDVKNLKMKNYKLSDFDSPDLPGSGENMDYDTLVLVDEAVTGMSYRPKVNSAYRTAAHNKKVGGVPNSAHTRGFAVDLTAVTTAQKRELLKRLYAQGFRRFGIMRGAIHTDNDSSLPAGVWDYDTTNPADWSLFNSLSKISKL